MNRRQLLFSAAAAAVAPALPKLAFAAEPSPFPPLYWRFTLANGRRVTRCGFPFDEAARSALLVDEIEKVERLDGGAWCEMRIFGARTLTPAYIDMLVQSARSWNHYITGSH